MCKRQNALRAVKESISSLIFLSSKVNDVRRKLYMVRIHLTVGKQAKRMPDTTVETTRNEQQKLSSYQNWNRRSN